MADGDVPLHGEGGQEEGRGVHGEELAVDHQGAARTGIMIMSLYRKCEREYELTSPTPTCPPVCGRTELPATHFNFNAKRQPLISFSATFLLL